MTLHYLIAIASFCDRKFEFIPGPESSELSLDEVRKQLAQFERVRGGTGEFCAFVFWQLKRNGYTPILWYVRDINGYEFYVVNILDYFVSYYDGKIYLNSECPWVLVKKSENLREWENVRNSINSTIRAD